MARKPRSRLYDVCLRQISLTGVIELPAAVSGFGWAACCPAWRMSFAREESQRYA